MTLQIKNSYPRSIKNFSNSTSKNPITQLENEILKKRERKKKENERRYLKMTLQINGWYPRSIKNFSNSTPKKQIIRSKNGKKIQTDTFPKMTHEWLTDT